MRQRYTHSGRAPLLGIVLGIGFGLVAVVPLSWLYDYGIIHVPSGKLRACFSMFFGMLAGAAAGWGMVQGKVRNNRAAALVGLVTSLAALYVSWGIWLILIIERPLDRLPALLAKPMAVWRLMGLVNTTGTWTTGGGSATKGTELWIIWILEALLIVVFGMGAGLVMIKSRSFCENCEHWCKKAGQVLIVPIMEPAELLGRVNQGGFEFLAEAKAATAKQPRYSFIWHSCPSCGTLNTLNVSLIQPKKNKQLASHLLITAAEVDLLRNFQGRTGAVMVAAAAAK